ncbi:MAG TPA: hypothetical protein VNG71_04785 [Pyrinomonadaceae bacterium]|nr:hypothetical protein [Pyrinomonadaceae bacterium]
MKRRIVYVLIASSLLTGIATLAYFQQGESLARASGLSPSPTPPSSQDIPPVRAGVIAPPPLWANKIRNARVKYLDSPSLSTFPVPAVIFRREALAREGDWSEIRERIIYPAVNKSERPIAAVVVEYLRDTPTIGVTLIWYRASAGAKTNYETALIERDSAGHFPVNAYLMLFSKNTNDSR